MGTIRKPNFFIVGAPKAATSSMSYYLGQHPDVFMLPSETWHFATDLATSAPWCVKVRSEYERLFENSSQEAILGEKSVLYLLSSTAAKAIYDFNPASRILAILRHPADLMYSLHRQFLTSGNDEIYDFEEALAAESDRARGFRIPKSAHAPEALQYRRVVRFVDQIQRYYDVFGRERVLILLYDDVRADLPNCYQSVLRFLKVDDRFVPDFRAKNVTAEKSVDNLNIRRLIKRNALAQFAVRSIPRPLRSLVGAGLSYINSGHSIDPHAKLSRDLRAVLTRELEPEIQDLGRLIHRDLSVWLMPEST
jgi:hypothetical protein